MANHVVRTYRVPADLKEVAVALLWGQGCEGVEELGEKDGFSALDAYFPQHLPAPLPGLEGLELVGQRDLVERDWLEAYRLGAQPLEIGRRFLIDPREPDEPTAEAKPGRVTLRLPARQAFGTGSHESTRLMLELMEEAPLDGAGVLDVGSGSGILSFAALVLGARSVVGFDLDLPSAVLAGEYRKLNDLHPAFFAGRLDALDAPQVFDILLVNVLPERIEPEIHRLPPMLRNGGEALFSGILQAKGPEVLSVLDSIGLEPLAERVAGDWIAYRCRR